MIIVNINGPAGSGKDTVCEALHTAFDMSKYVVVHMEFKEMLFEVAVRTSGMTRDLWDAFYDRIYKEEPNPFLMINGKHVSPRQWMIHCSESVMKPIFGEDVFGQAFAKKIAELNEEVSSSLVDRELAIVVSDGGFLDESLPVIDYVGQENYFLIRLHRLKPDGTEYTFAGDSRRYLYAKEFPFGSIPHETDVLNVEGEILETAQKIVDFVEGINGI